MPPTIAIDITVQRGYQMKLHNGKEERLASAGLTICLVSCDFAEALPGLLVEHAERLKLEPGILPGDIRVRVQETDANSPDAPNIRINAQLTKQPTGEANRFAVGDELRKIIIEWFSWPGEFIPERLVVDVP